MAHLTPALATTNGDAADTHAILLDYALGDRTLRDIITTHKLRLDTFLAWLESAPVRTALARLNAVIERQHIHAAANALLTATRALTRLLDSPVMPETLRKAATDLLKRAGGTAGSGATAAPAVATPQRSTGAQAPSPPSADSSLPTPLPSRLPPLATTRAPAKNARPRRGADLTALAGAA